ncbi:MAG: CRISPR-associated protein Cmr3 [Synechococcaceae cyanobacterium SM2_3_1]|nr:CRISPR-associated protein Cmr3 [Synechococcaceae cyanobacterium SM2_3_1]
MFDHVKFTHLVEIRPLGFLYGSAGRFLSPENLVGRSGQQFPPGAATLSGLFAAQLDSTTLESLTLAGPFWAWSNNLQNFYVPTPLHCLVKRDSEQIQAKLTFDQVQKCWSTSSGKFKSGTWTPIQEWDQIARICSEPWQFSPHLHPRLEADQRRVDVASDQGSLFLENAVELNPDASLIFLSTVTIPDGWYRFGGEGHMVELSCHPLAKTTSDLLAQPVGASFALITPGLWGSNRLSYREPMCDGKPVWSVEGMLTERPHAYRYRLGGKGSTKRLSRGRYAVSAGTVYVLSDYLGLPWQDWDPNWFPQEAYPLKRWGCALALPLPDVISQINPQVA